MEAELRAGVAVYNAGRYHTAHDAWEDRWLAIKDDPDRRDDERLLHGLIQFTAAVHHGHRGNWAGLRGLAESAGSYLEDLPPAYAGINIQEIRSYLGAVATDPEHIERTRPPALTHEGTVVRYEDLDFDAVVIVAAILAEESDRYEEAVIDAGIDAARRAIEAEESDEFVALLFDFVTEIDRRSLVYRRLEDHLDRREREREDVSGLFDP